METNQGNQINWPPTCRICLKSTDINMRHIFGELCSVSDDIVTKIIKCGGVPVDIMDGMPDRICHQCLLDLDVSYKFRKLCQESYYQLHKLLDSSAIDQKQCDTYEFHKLKDEPDSDSDNLHSLSNSNTQGESFDTIYLNEESFIDEDTLFSSVVKSPSSKDDIDKKRHNPKTARSTSHREEKKVKKGRSVDPSTTYICYCCGNLYKSQSKLSQHIKLHSAEKPHECEICKKTFAQAAQLSRHMNSHTGNRPYKCKYCPSSFADPSTCIKHERIHTNDRPFKCGECGKAFSYSNVLKVHQKIHTGEKPFSCSVCDKKFTQLHHKKSHERTHSGFIDNESIKKVQIRTRYEASVPLNK